jgi:hypothetical protein
MRLAENESRRTAAGSIILIEPFICLCYKLLGENIQMFGSIYKIEPA